MTVGDDFADLMPNLVTVKPYLGRDRYGKPSYGVPIVVRGRRVFKAKLVRSPTGEEVVSGSFVTFDPVPGMNKENYQQSFVSVDGDSPPILAVESAPDETGTDYYVRIRFQ